MDGKGAGMKKRMLSLALALTVAGNLGVMTVPRAQAEEIVIEEADDVQSALPQETEPEAEIEVEPAVPEAESEGTDVVTIAVDDAQAAEEAETPCITAIVPPEQTEYAPDVKPGLDDLLEQFPQTLTVYLDGAAEPHEIPVRWECGTDFDDTSEPSYRFTPVWEGYALDPSLTQDDIPSLTVVLNETAETPAVSVLDYAAPVITGISGTETSVKLTWKAVSGANRYHIYRKTASTDWEKIGISETTSYTDTSAQTDTTYLYAIRSIHIENGAEVRSERSQPVTRVGRPKLTELKESSGGNLLKWGAVDSAAGYEVYRRTSGAEDWKPIERVTGTSYTDSTAKYGTKYYYAVRAYCANGNSTFFSAYSAGKSLKRTVATPKVTKISGTGTTVTLVWNKVSGAKRYRVQRMESGGKWKTLASTDKLSYRDKSANAYKTYRYRVCAVRESGGKTTYGMGQVPGLQRPGKTRLTSAVNETAGIRISWQAVDSVKKYRVYRKSKNSDSWKYLATVSELSYLDESVSLGNTYRYTVRAVGRNPESFYGGFDTGGMQAERSYATAVIAELSNTEAGVRIKWDKVSKATGYRVCRKSAGASKWTVLKKSTVKSSFTDETASAGKKYTYSIRTIYKGDKLSGYAPSRSITRLKMPSLKRASSAGGGVQVTWSAASGASGYEIYRRSGADAQWEQMAKVKGRTKTSYLDLTAVNGTSYTYTVCAYYGSTKSAMNQTGVSTYFLKPVEIEDLIQEESKTVKITWQGNDKADGYILSYSTSESFRTEQTIQASRSPAKVSGLDVEEIYYFRIKAYKTFGGERVETPWSESQIVAIEE